MMGHICHFNRKKWAFLIALLCFITVLSACTKQVTPEVIPEVAPTVQPSETQDPAKETSSPAETPEPENTAAVPAPPPEVLKPEEVIVTVEEREDEYGSGETITYYQTNYRNLRKYSAVEKAGTIEEFQAFVAASENFFRRHDMGVVPEGTMEIYVDPIINQRYIDDDHSYYHRPSLEINWLLMEDLYYLTGNRYANAGVVRGLSFLDAEKQGLEIPVNRASLNEEDMKTIITDLFNDEDWSWKLIMDAQAFSPIWSTEENIDKLNQLSYSFASYLVEKLGWKDADAFSLKTSEMTMESDVDLTIMKNHWLDILGLTVALEVPEDLIRFPHSFTWFTFKDPDAYEEDFFLTRSLRYQYNENYSVVFGPEPDLAGMYRKWLFEEEMQIDKVKAMTAPYYPSPTERISVFVVPEELQSYAFPEDNTIQLSYFGPMAHEYAHIITAKTDYQYDNRWTGEGLATYLATLAYVTPEDLSYYLEENSPNEYDAKVRAVYCKLYNVEAFPTRAEDIYLGFQVDFNGYFEMYDSQEDGNNFETLFENQSEDSVGLTYNSAASLIHYIIRNYGEDKFYAMYKDYDNYEEILGKSHKEMRAEWKSHIMEAFKGYLDD